ncbi:Na(+)-translocating NADH-quinone reductase subunit A [Myxococcota bacterium]|nr:Na(+)-translocating NADH-quinone reductase subunit A [Myxococcota bacterium]
MHEIRKGLDVPISGAPIQSIRNDALPERVAVMAEDFPGMKPRMLVEEGEIVARGQALFEDRKNPGVLHTSPGAGRVAAIHRGAKRALQSVVIALSEDEREERAGEDAFQNFASFTHEPVSELSREQVVALLVESGQWVSLRTRPFGKVPAIDSTPHAIFVTATDTNPLALLPDVAIGRRREDFARGLEVVSKLTEGTTYLCIHEDSDADEGIEAPVSVQRFSGPHPAGTAGLHIHLLDPVGRHKTVWTVGYQDVIAIGNLFATGVLDVERIISLAGPLVDDPRLVRTRLGASVEEVAGDEGTATEARRIAGSVLSGRSTSGEPFGFLGRHHNQISVLAEGRERLFMGWLTPGWNAFSSLPIYLSRLFPGKRFPMTTTTNGSPRAMVPLGTFEKVMPMDILPTFLLRSLVVGDVEEAEKLGALELEEEDLALCSFICASKTDYGPLLRKNLEIIEKEG